MTANALEFRCALQLKPLARIAVVTAALKPLDRCPADDGFKGRALDLDSVKVLLGLAVDTDFHGLRSEEHTSELQSLMRISYAVFCLQNTNTHMHTHLNDHTTFRHSIQASVH